MATTFCTAWLKRAAQMFLLLLSPFLLSSCSMVGGLLSYLLQLPFNVLGAFIP
ncbi:MAG: hypothetical protein IKK45_00755 [Akkermansia sp.]|nr:hypothetical protein [Akkermansia sp.]